MAKSKKQAENKAETMEVINNSLSGLVGSLSNDFTGAQVSQQGTLYYNLRWYLISNNRQLLAQLYTEHGLVQTLIDQPVDDGLSTGFQIKTGELSPEEIGELEVYIERMGVIRELAQATKWARLFGGGALLVITGQDPAEPLDLNDLEGEKLEFRAVDMWELYRQNMNVQNQPAVVFGQVPLDDDFYTYYGIKVHKSRVFPIKGKEAPSFVRPRLTGWGMSEIERLIRSINQYMKNQDVLFELMDEAKVDVYKIKGFNTAMMSAQGTAGVAKRVQGANQIKNFLNALTMDMEDDYSQKQISFTGLAEVFKENRMQVSSDLKMPMSKLFGIPSTGFSSGEDDLENYNSMVNSDVRSKIKFIIVDTLALCCQNLFGIMPSDLTIEWNPLRQLSSDEEQARKNSEYNRLTSAYESGAITRQEWAQGVNKSNLLPIEIDEDAEGLPPLEGSFLVGGGDKVDT